MDNIIVGIAFFLNNAFWIMAFLFMKERDHKYEKERFREFSFSVKAKDLPTYIDSLPTEGDLPIQKQDDLVELDQIPEEHLLKSLRKQYGVSNK